MRCHRRIENEASSPGLARDTGDGRTFVDSTSMLRTCYVADSFWRPHGADILVGGTVEKGSKSVM